jgi:hypothetical protein
MLFDIQVVAPFHCNRLKEEEWLRLWKPIIMNVSDLVIVKRYNKSVPPISVVFFVVLSE